jgi:hypothetical protein
VTCPSCYWDQAIVYCDVTPFDNCQCTTCLDQRYLDTHPLASAEQEYFELEDAAQVAYEAERDDWRDVQAEATAAYRRWQRLLRRGDGIQAGQARAAPERSDGEA